MLVILACNPSLLNQLNEEVLFFLQSLFLGWRISVSFLLQFSATAMSSPRTYLTMEVQIDLNEALTIACPLLVELFQQSCIVEDRWRSLEGSWQCWQQILGEDAGSAWYRSSSSSWSEVVEVFLYTSSYILKSPGSLRSQHIFLSLSAWTFWDLTRKWQNVASF